jgi:pimeloyl-ACP methyl ester carboxylesterase
MRSAFGAVTLSQGLRAVLAVAALIAAATSAQAQAGPWGAGAGKGKGTGRYADVNGIKLYYEIHGSGRPLILLHGGLGAIEMFGPNLPALAKRRQVIAVDLQGHGRTADIDRPLSVELMADDIAEIAGITATALIVAGDADIFPPAHAVELFGLLGGGQRDAGWDGSGCPKSRLAILPGLTHYNIFSDPALAATVIPFLDEPTPTGK